ncbi:MAG: carbohydrate porin [Myxococcota bacterium]
MVLRHKPAGNPGTVEVAGEFNGWTPTALGPPDAQGYREVDLGALSPGEYGFRYVYDGSYEDVLPINVYTRWDGTTENRDLRVGDCMRPLLQTVTARAEPGGALHAEVQVAVAADASPVDAASVQVTVGDQSVPAQVDADGLITVDASGLPPGKHSLRVWAADEAGRRAENEPLFVPLWVEDDPFEWDDALMYFVFTDRFRNGDWGADLFPPVPGVANSANYQGGDFLGVLDALNEGYFDDLGVKVLWLSPSYENADGSYLGVNDGRPYSGYHGYWPIDPLGIEERFGDQGADSESRLDELIATAHEHGIRVLFDLVLNHVHQDHAYVSDHPEWFGPGCVCGSPGCGWEEKPVECWFTDYLPDLNYKNDAIKQQVIADTLRLVELHDVDAVRIDAAKHMDHVIMRTLRMRLRDDYEAGGGAPFWLVGETFTGSDGHGLIMDYVSDWELSGQFDFPLFWGIRDTFAHDASFRGLEGSVATGERLRRRAAADVAVPRQPRRGALRHQHRRRRRRLLERRGARPDGRGRRRGDGVERDQPHVDGVRVHPDAARRAARVLRRRDRAARRRRPRQPAPHALRPVPVWEPGRAAGAGAGDRPGAGRQHGPAARRPPRAVGRRRPAGLRARQRRRRRGDRGDEQGRRAARPGRRRERARRGGGELRRRHGRRRGDRERRAAAGRARPVAVRRVGAAVIALWALSAGAADLSFGSYGRVTAVTDAQGGQGQAADVVSWPTRLMKGPYVELDAVFDHQLDSGQTFEVVITPAVAGNLFHYDGQWDAAIALRNLFAEVGAAQAPVAVWAGSRMVRGDDVYLLDMWPLDNLNLVGGGVRWTPSPWALSASVGVARTLDGLYQVQTTQVPVAGGVGAEPVLSLDRQRIVGALKGGRTFDAGDLTFRVQAYGELHGMPAGERVQDDLFVQELPADRGTLVGAEVSAWGWGQDSFVHLFARRATGLAAYGTFAVPTGLATDYRAREAREGLVALAANHQQGRVAVLGGAYLRRFTDADANRVDVDDRWEANLAVRPTVFLGQIASLGVEASQQWLRPDGLNPRTQAHDVPAITRLAVLPAIQPAPSSFARPQVRLQYVYSHLNDDARQWFAAADPRHDSNHQHFVGIGAEWWLDSESYRR